MYQANPAIVTSAIKMIPLTATTVVRNDREIDILLITMVSRTTHSVRADLPSILDYLKKRRNPSVPFVPPKPNELESAISILHSRAVCGT